MNKQIQPKYFSDVEVECACGAKTTTSSVIPGPLRVEICSQCHPFFTGEKKLVDTEGRVDKFQRMQEQAAVYKEEKSKKDADKGDVVDDKPARRKSLREMLQEVK